MKNQFVETVLFTLLYIGLFSNPTLAQNYKTIFEEDFEDSAKSVKLWGPATSYTFTEGYSGKGIVVNNTSAARAILLTTNIPVDSIKGATISLSAMVRGENLSIPAQTWLGMKVMLVITEKSGTKTYPQLSADTGTFGWTGKGNFINVPPNVTSIKLSIGIQESVGKMWFDNIKIQRVINPADMPPARDSNIPIKKYHSLQMSRGMNVAENIDRNSLNELGNEWKANHIRWQIGGFNYPNGLLRSDFDVILAKELKLLDSATEWCNSNGLEIIADLHTLSEGLFTSKNAQTRLIETWKQIATRYKGNTAVWAYDLANEPNYQNLVWPGDGFLLWNELADTLVKEIRKIDPEKPIIIENLNFLLSFADFKPIDFTIPNIIYSIHFYEPFVFTHQTLYGNLIKYTYPGTIAGKYYDKTELKKLFQPIKDFQDKYRMPIYVGEFSAIRWAANNSAYNYIRDCVEIFEEYNWDWSYHSYREYDGWSVEYTNDSTNMVPAKVPTDRENLLRSYFGQHIISGNKIGTEAVDLKCYPNPANTILTVEIPAINSKCQLTINSITGQEIMSRQINTGRTQLDISNLKSGIYFIKFLIDDTIEIRKIIKE